VLLSFRRGYELKFWESVENEAGWLKAIASNYPDTARWLTHRDLAEAFVRNGYPIGAEGANPNASRKILELKMAMSRRLDLYASAGLMRQRDAEAPYVSAVPGRLEVQPTQLGRWLCDSRDGFLQTYFVLILAILRVKAVVKKFWIIVVLSGMGTQLVKAYEFHRFLLSHLSEGVAWLVVFVAFSVGLYFIQRAFFNRD
jgi:hypothetical protein